MDLLKQIGSLTVELEGYPDGCTKDGFIFNGSHVQVIQPWLRRDIDKWFNALYRSYEKAEVDEYADCFLRLKLYCLIARKKAKEFPLFREGEITLNKLHGTDFIGAIYPEGAVITRRKIEKPCVLGGVWFAHEEDRLEAIKICGIDQSFQKKCAKYGLGGA